MSTQWKVTDLEGSGFVVMDAEDFPVAMLGYATEAAEANAHLIAAAPDLLAALKRAVSVHGIDTAEGAEEAIAKAEGKS